MPLPALGPIALLGGLVATGALLRGYRAWRVDQAWRLQRRFRPDGILEGAEPFEYAGNRGRAVLLVHGSGDTPQSLRALARTLNARGYHVRALLLPGHGRSPRALAATGAAAWLDHVRGELDALEGRFPWVAIVGQSMGGALAVRVAAERPRLPAMVLLAPYLSVLPLVRQMARLAPLWGATIPFLPAGGEASILDAKEREQALGYGMVSPRALRALVRTADAAAGALPRVQVPTLVLQSRADNRISVLGAEAAFARLGAADKRLVWLEEGGHVISVDHGRERVFALTEEWLGAHGGLALPK